MKILRWMCIFLLILGMAPLRLAGQDAKATQDALTNQDIVDLVKTGLSPDIIVAKIKTSTCQFDTSTAALKGLKDAGVPDAVVLAMVDPSSKTTGAADAPKSDAAASSGFAYVRVYRPKLLPGSGFNPSIFVDDKEVFRLVNARRCSVKITPGPHTISPTTNLPGFRLTQRVAKNFTSACRSCQAVS